MKKNATILIADRNPHIRGFLKRELALEGLRAITADSWRKILHYAFGPGPVDLLVVDPDLPDLDTKILLEKLEGRLPPLPIILHTLPGESWATEAIGKTAVVVEKEGKSIEHLKKVIHNILSAKSAIDLGIQKPPKS